MRLQDKIKHIFSAIANLFFLTLFLLTLSIVFIINLANGVVSIEYFWFYISVGFVSFAALFDSISKFRISSFGFRVSMMDWLVLLFTCNVLFSALVFGNVSANTTKLALLVLLSVLYFCLRIVLQGITGHARNDKVLFICFFIILTGLVEAIWGLQQLYGFKPSQHGLFKLTGSFFNPGPYAGYLAVVFPLALSYWMDGTRMTQIGRMGADENSENNSNRWGLRVKSATTTGMKIFAAVSCIAIILVLPAAMSRAAWLAAIAGSVIIVIPRLKRNPLLFVWGLRVKPAMTGLIIVLFLSATLTGMYYLKKDSADGRLLTWKVSLSVIAKHPCGVGLGHFPGAYGDAQAAYFASGKASETEEYVAGNPEYGFNEFLQIAIESGIHSLLLFIGVLVCATKGLIKKKEWGILGSLIALMVFACFSYPFSVLPFPILLVFLLAMSGDGTRIERMGRIGADNNLKSAFIRVISVPLLCLITTAFCLYRQYPVYDAYKQWNRHRVFYNMGMYKEAAQNYELLYPYLNDQIKFLFEYGRSLSQLGINDVQGVAGQARNDSSPLQGGKGGYLVKSNKVLQRAMKISCDPMLYNIMGRNYQALKEYDLAEQNLLKSTHIVPNRLYPWYLLMKLYVETGDEEKAREMAGIVLTKEPKVQSTAVREMREEAGELKTKR